MKCLVLLHPVFPKNIILVLESLVDRFRKEDRFVRQAWDSLEMVASMKEGSLVEWMTEGL